MRISREGAVCLLAVVGLCMAGASAESIVYIPVVWANASEPVDPTREICTFPLRFWGTTWKTEILCVNNGQQEGLLTSLQVFGDVGQGQRPPYPVPVTPGGVNDVFPDPPFGVGVLKARLGDGLTVSSSLKRIDHWCPFSPGSCADITQGSTPLRIESAPFQAGQNTMTDAILLGNPGLYCAPQNQRYIPRVNVTLVNTSSSPASFRVIVKVRRLGTDHRSEAPTVFDNSYAVEPLDVYQANA